MYDLYIFTDMKNVVPILLVVTTSFLVGNVYPAPNQRADWKNLSDLDKMDYVVDLVNEIELKMACVQDMTMRVNTLEVFVYVSTGDVVDGLATADDHSKIIELQKKMKPMPTR